MTREEKFNDYEGFVEKFKPKKTTDDCMTPPEIYEVVRDYACKRWDIDPACVVRPFWPGGDYERFDYAPDSVVIDNPPFSILAQICDFYLEHGIPFFLFAPSLTLFSGKNAKQINHIVCDADIVYENGAVVKTSFLTSYGLPTIVETSPELTGRINYRMQEVLKEKKREIPKYSYPDNVITSALLQKYAKYGIEFSVQEDEAEFIRQLDAQRDSGKAIYGGGFLISERAAAERAAAERAAAERAAAERAAAERWMLSAREWEIIKRLR